MSSKSEVYYFEAWAKPIQRDFDDETLALIVDRILLNSIDTKKLISGKYGKLSGWIASKLGSYAEGELASENYKVAENLATTGIVVAKVTSSSHQLYANILTLGNVHLRVGQYEIAEDIYNRILCSDTSRSLSQIPIAHANLSTIHLNLKNYAKCIYHLELFLLTSNPEPSKELKVKHFNNLCHCYLKTLDITGGIICLKENKENYRSAIDKLLPAFETSTTNAIMKDVSRLRLLGHNDLADIVYNYWNNSRSFNVK